MSSELDFTKLSATGNDFVLLDLRDREPSYSLPELALQICERRTSVGADGLLCITSHPDLDFRLRYFNADGSEAECGNGARASAYYAAVNGIAGAHQRFLFGTTVYEAQIDHHRVNLLMGETRGYDPAPGAMHGDEMEEGGFIDTGVPHYVLFCDDVAAIDVPQVGAFYRKHKRFQPDGCNVNFVEAMRNGDIRIRTFERGVEAETLSCGTGCVASAIISSRKKNLKMPLNVVTAGGILIVSQQAGTNRYFLEGDVKPVYNGRLL